MKAKIRRGDIYCFELEENRWQNYLVIQNDIGNKYCPSIIVVPLTDNLRSRKLFFTLQVEANPASGLEKDHVALFFLVRTFDRNRFTDDRRVGSLSNGQVAAMDEVLKLSLGLSTLQQLENRLKAKKTS